MGKPSGQAKADKRKLDHGDHRKRGDRKIEAKAIPVCHLSILGRGFYRRAASRFKSRSVDFRRLRIASRKWSTSGTRDALDRRLKSEFHDPAGREPKIVRCITGVLSQRDKQPVLPEGQAAFFGRQDRTA